MHCLSNSICKLCFRRTRIIIPSLLFLLFGLKSPIETVEEGLDICATPIYSRCPSRRNFNDFGDKFLHNFAPSSGGHHLYSSFDSSVIYLCKTNVMAPKAMIINSHALLLRILLNGSSCIKPSRSDCLMRISSSSFTHFISPFRARASALPKLTFRTTASSRIVISFSLIMLCKI